MFQFILNPLPALHVPEQQKADDRQQRQTRCPQPQVVFIDGIVAGRPVNHLTAGGQILHGQAKTDQFAMVEHELVGVGGDHR